MSGLRRGARRPTTAPPPTVARLEWAHRPFTTTPSARWTASVRPTAPPLPTRLPRRAHCLKGARGRVCVFAYGVGLSSGTAVDRRYRPGAYVRIILDKIPCEFVEGFDPRMPVIVGGLLPTEDTLGFMQVGGCRQTETARSLKRMGTPPPPPQVRLKKHRWHARILKNGDPLIFSVGWRRFQSLPLFSVKDDGQRNRLLKYTPEHMHCMAVFYGVCRAPS
jgi:hypothetical protein